MSNEFRDIEEREIPVPTYGYQCRYSLRLASPYTRGALYAMQCLDAKYIILMANTTSARDSM